MLDGILHRHVLIASACELPVGVLISHHDGSEMSFSRADPGVAPPPMPSRTSAQRLKRTSITVILPVHGATGYRYAHGSSGGARF